MFLWMQIFSSVSDLALSAISHRTWDLFWGEKTYVLLRNHSVSCSTIKLYHSTELCKLIEHFRVNFEAVRRRFKCSKVNSSATLVHLLGTTPLSHTTPWLTISRRNYYFYILRRPKNQEVRLQFPLYLGIIIQEIKEISEEKQPCSLSYGVNSCDSVIPVKMTVHMAHLVPM